MIESNRQCGKTTRIINNVIEQLYSVGQCIATDHTCFEHESPTKEMVEYFIEKVKYRVEVQSYGSKTVNTDIVLVDIEGKKIPVGHFALLDKKH